MIHPLDKAILRTMLWFDLFDFPLTSFEIGRFLYQPRFFPSLDGRGEGRVIFGGYSSRVSLNHILERLARSVFLQHHLQNTNGFYHLRGRAEIVAVRAERHQITTHRLTNWRFRTALRLTRFVPFVRFVAIVNTAAYSNMKESSDIDFFIMVKNGYLYLSRSLITFLFQIFGARRHGRLIAGRACLSFYVTEDGAELSKLFLSGGDPYFHFWIATMRPVFDVGGGETLRQKNSWLKDFFSEDLFDLVLSFPFLQDTRWSKLIRKAGEWILSRPYLSLCLENFCRHLQIQKMKKHPCAVSRQPNASIIVSNNTLKFHEDDQRFALRQEFYTRLQQSRL